MTHSFDPNNYRSPWNPRDERPEGPFQVSLTDEESLAIVGVIGQSWNDAGQSRIHGSPECDRDLDLDWMNKFRKEVIHKMGKGLNGFDERTIRYLIGTMKQEASQLGIVEPSGILEAIDKKDIFSALRKLELAAGDVPSS